MFKLPIAAVMLASAAVALPEPAAKPLSETCPNLNAAERAEIERVEEDRGAYRELTYYSRTYCVSLPEARRRMDIQHRDAIGAETEPGGPPKPPQNSIGSVAQRIAANEAETFAGLWIEHRPTYRVVVAFTRNAAATLRRYTDDPLFVPLDRPGPSEAELRATRERLSKALQRFGARPATSGTYIMTGRVQFEVLGDMGPFRAAVARGEVELPAYVDIHEPAPLGIAAPPLPAGWRNLVKAFPRWQFRSGGAEHDMLQTGTVVLEDGCLRLKRERRSPVIVWPNEAALDLIGSQGRIRILNRRSGEAIDLGKAVNLGGNAGDLRGDANLVDSDPAACPGPYFLMGNFGRMDRFYEGQLQRRASEIEQERRLPRAEALRIAREERAREERFGEIADRLLREAPEAFGGLYAHQGRATIKVVGDARPAILTMLPADLRPLVQWGRAPRPLAALKAEKNRFLDQVEALGLAAGAYEDVDQGRIIISAEDLAALSRAVVAGTVTIPAGAQLQSNGAMPEGEYGEAKFQALNRALEAVPDWAEMRALVEATKVPGFLVAYKEGEPDRGPTRAQSLEITRFLVSMGYTAEDLKALHAEGLYPARAYVEQNGRAAPANRALLAQEVALAEIVEVKQELLGDGYRSTVRIRVLEGLKGDLQARDEARVRFISGLGADGRYHHSNEEPMLLPGFPSALRPGGRWLMFLSEQMRARQAALVGKSAEPSPGGRIFASLYGPWPVTGDGVAATYLEPSPGDLPLLRSQLAAVDAAFDRAARKRGAPLQRRQSH